MITDSAHMIGQMNECCRDMCDAHTYLSHTYQVSSQGRSEVSVHVYTLCFAFDTTPYPKCIHYELVCIHTHTRVHLNTGDGSDNNISSDSNSNGASSKCTRDLPCTHQHAPRTHARACARRL